MLNPIDIRNVCVCMHIYKMKLYWLNYKDWLYWHKYNLLVHENSPKMCLVIMFFSVSNWAPYWFSRGKLCQNILWHSILCLCYRITVGILKRATVGRKADLGGLGVWRMFVIIWHKSAIPFASILMGVSSVVTCWACQVRPHLGDPHNPADLPSDTGSMLGSSWLAFLDLWAHSN